MCGQGGQGGHRLHTHICAHTHVRTRTYAQAKNTQFFSQLGRFYPDTPDHPDRSLNPLRFSGAGVRFGTMTRAGAAPDQGSVLLGSKLGSKPLKPSALPTHCAALKPRSSVHLLSQLRPIIETVFGPAI